MQTLDRRISASSDQLDTLRKQVQSSFTVPNANVVLQKCRQRPLRTRSSSRLSFERRCEGEAGGVPHLSRRETGAKTPFEMFLEDDGPYSRYYNTTFYLFFGQR